MPGPSLSGDTFFHSHFLSNQAFIRIHPENNFNINQVKVDPAFKNILYVYRLVSIIIPLSVYAHYDLDTLYRVYIYLSRP